MSPAKAEKGRPHGVGHRAVGNHHVADRFGVARDGGPHADGLEQPAGGRRNRRGALVAHGATQSRIGDHHGETRSEALAQRDPEGQARQTSAGDDHVGTGSFTRLVRHHRTLIWRRVWRALAQVRLSDKPDIG
jgi:hypothetical protein